MNIFEFVEWAKENGLSPEETEHQWNRELEAREQELRASYENDPWVHEGWAQQDLIDLYRVER